ncbi:MULTISPECIES: leucyl aminopeptidase [unclassified Pusillimonas]|uniref:leucyl aminopeptidase n=1 Tax=unclassified Pusillimonas TaxID=2640016 RepID=UPI000B9D24A4|nr:MULTISPECIES: leucyl aminopeptidase [unclassified Pusillimonas]OXR50369.1 leucyl aminopeptidase [Pusillimonas sp. T2]ROT44660.1 leucyl aminopeptidase [Pusillimonas sp. NJUB218]
MEFSTNTTTTLHTLKTAALAVGVFAEGQLTAAAKIIDDASNGAVRDAVKAEFPGTAGTQLVLRNLAGISAQRVILIGLGKQEAYNAKTHAAAEQSFAKYCVQAQLTEGVSTLARTDCKDSTLQQRTQALAVAVGQATYQYDATLGKASKKTAPKLKKISTWVTRAEADEANAGLQSGRAMANGMQLARTLGDLPGNICTPTYLGNTAKKLAKTHKTLKVEVLGLKQLQELGMGSFLSVAKGSDEPPVFIVIKYTPAAAAKAARAKAKAPVVLVGKGITFDSGGISIKPGANMDEMKYDMCGAASVVGTMQAVAELGISQPVIGLIPACENLPSGRANKPGDVVTSMSGQTIEILNTDAEGRLILCDALTYAERFKPAAVVDIATLTGACVVALGHVNTGLFSADDALADQLLAAGKQSGDPAWRMPLDDAYQEQLRSNFADMANIGGMPAGSVTAACFLSRFAKAYKWAHLDIAGTAWRSGKDKGASGRPVPLLVQFLLNQA